MHKGGEMEQLVQNLAKVQIQIAEAEESYNELLNRNKVTVHDERDCSWDIRDQYRPGYNKKQQVKEADIEKFLEQIRTCICNVAEGDGIQDKTQKADLSTKATLDILRDIESLANRRILEIHMREQIKTAPKGKNILNLERDQKQQFFQSKRQTEKEKAKAQNEKTAQAQKEKLMRIYQKVGKQSMVRSKKKGKKKEKVKIDKTEEEINNMIYLKSLDPMMQLELAKLAQQKEQSLTLQAATASASQALREFQTDSLQYGSGDTAGGASGGIVDTTGIKGSGRQKNVA